MGYEPSRSPELLYRIAGLGAQDLAFSPNGRILAVGFTAGVGVQDIHEDYQLWDVSDPRHPRLFGQFAEPPGLIDSGAGGLTFSRGGRFLSANLNGQGIDVWNVSNPHKPSSVGIAGREDSLDYPAFTSDGHSLIAGSPTGIWRIWNLTESGLKSQGRTLFVSPTHTSGNITVSPDGTLAAVQDSDALRVWDISDPGSAVLLAELPTTGGPISFSPSGSFLVTGLYGGGVQVWDMNFSNIEQQLCQNIGTPMTAGQWRQYLPSQPFAPPCRS